MFLRTTIPMLSGLLLAAAAPSLAAQPAGYYDGADASSAQALRDSLHAIIDDHQRYPYTSDATDTWDILELADQDLEDDSRIVTVYRNASIAKFGGGEGPYNREHSWPKSYGYPDDGPENYPYTDMHALFLSDPDYNYARSNSPFGACSAACNEFPTEATNGRGGAGGGYPGDSNWQTGEYTDGTWEVWKGRRGDIARALMYLDVRYAGGTHGVTGFAEPDLVLTDDLELIRASYTFDNQPIGYMGMLSTLLQWHREDPVDLAEVQHHETVAAFQGNRNPLIDHPEWVECVFEGVCARMRINAGVSDAWYNPQTSGQGFFIVAWESLQQVFLSWFTYDAERPAEDAQATLGEPGHRWLTAQGAFDGDSALLDLYSSSGGVFDSPDPVVPPPTRVGTLRLHFEDCSTGRVSYEIDASGHRGVIPIRRIVNDNVALCEALIEP